MLADLTTDYVHVMLYLAWPIARQPDWIKCFKPILYRGRKKGTCELPKTNFGKEIFS